MRRLLIPVCGLILILTVIPGLYGIAQQPDKKSTFDGELVVGKRYHFIPIGKDYFDQGTLAEVVATDTNWVKVKTFLPEPRHVWINLNQVGAIKTTEKLAGPMPIEE